MKSSANSNSHRRYRLHRRRSNLTRHDTTRSTVVMRGFHLHVSVPPFPYRLLSVAKVRKNYVHPQEFRKNSVAYVKNNVLRFRKFAVAVKTVSVQAVHIGSSSIFPYLPFVRACSSAHSVALFPRPASGVLGLPCYYRAQAPAATA